MFSIAEHLEFAWYFAPQHSLIQQKVGLLVTTEHKLDVLKTIYQEASAHLRATDEKRDRLFEVYIAVVLALASGLVLLRVDGTQLNNQVVFLSLILIGLMLLLGNVVLFAMVGARKWHAEYVNVFAILHAMMSQEVFTVSSNLVAPNQRHTFVGSIFTSRVILLVQASIFGTYLMGANILSETVVSSSAYAITAIVGIVNWILNHQHTRDSLIDAERKFWNNPQESWVFSGLNFPTT